MQFESPWLLLVAIPALILTFLGWKNIHGMARSRKLFALVVRIVLLVLASLALAGPQVWSNNKGSSIMFVVDKSDSVSDADNKAATTFINEAMSKLGPDDVAGVVGFGAQAILDSAPGGRRAFGGIQSKIDGTASDLAAAVRLAVATSPTNKGRRIVIFSDGNETRGDLMQAAEVCRAEGVVIDVVPLGTKPRQAEAAILELITPNEKRADEPFVTRVVIESSVAQTATVVIDRNGTVISRQKVSLDKGKSTYSLDQKLIEPGFYRYRATLEAPADTDNRNNVGSGFTSVRGKPKILLLQGDTSKQELARALQNQGIDVGLYGAAGVPVRAEDLQPYDAVILNDLNAQFVTPGQMKLLQAAVRDTGIGFAMIGGENSFLPGGWYGTPVAEALPVDLNIRQRKTYPSTAVLVVIDASGSMGAMEDGVQKIQLAAKAAEETVKLLSPLDRIGVAGSSDGIELVAPLQELKNKESVISQIKKLRPGMGGIYSAPSIKFADEKLMAENTKVRHLILLADGNDVDDYGNSIDVVSRMRANKISTSVVAIGDGKDVPFLRALAAAGGGKFYLATKASKLPAIFTQDVALMSRSAIEEMVFVPELRGGEESLRGFVSGEFPALMAYCLSDARPLARVGLVSPKKDPILASWQYGLGTSMAFTSDAQPRWAARWIEWDGFARFWSQAMRSITRKSTLNEYQMSVTQAGANGQIELSALDRLGNPISASEMTVRVSSPTGETQDVVLTQEAPGKFSGAFPSPELGSYIVTVAESKGAGQKRVNSSGFSVTYPPEYRNYRTNTPLMTSVAEITGGKLVKSSAETLARIPNPGSVVVELWPLLILICALMLPFDVAVRRLAIPFRELLHSIWVKVTNQREPDEVATRRIEKLQTAKMRVSQEASSAVAPTAKERTETASPVQPEPPKTTHISAASRLLEERRKRMSEEDS